MSAKRPTDDDLPAAKRAKMNLESSSPEKTSESDTEYAHSFQGHNTDLANDTSDTTSSSDVPPRMVEYEVAESEREKFRFYISDDSLDNKSLPNKVLKVSAVENVDNGLLGDTSEENSTSPTSNSDVDPSLTRNDYLDFEKCVLCSSEKKNTSYPYCCKCFRWKKSLFPKRPKRRKQYSKWSETESSFHSKSDNISDLQSNKNNSSSQNQGQLSDSGMGNTDATQSEDAVDGPSQSSQFSQSSQPSESSVSSSIYISTSTSTSDLIKPDLCGVCLVQPENGLFLHSAIAHKYGCYECAKEIWHENGCCPLCRRKVYKVVKLYP